MQYQEGYMYKVGGSQEQVAVFINGSFVTKKY